MSIYNINVYDIDGKLISLKEYENKVILIINSATSCGLTPQYSNLQYLYDKYKNQGFIILDFPCNQFMNQAKGSDEEIKTFCETRFNVTFPQFKKIDVNGKSEHELYTYLKKEKGGLLNLDIKWNFTKFLIDRNGKVIKRFSPIEDFKKIEKEIVKLL